MTPSWVLLAALVNVSSGSGAPRIQAPAAGRVGVFECQSQALSPDGRVLACVSAEGTLRFVDAASSRAIFEKKRFGKWDYSGPTGWCETPTDSNGVAIAGSPHCEAGFPMRRVGNPGSATFSFSPDSRYIVAFPTVFGVSHIAFDTREKRRIRLKGALRGTGRVEFVGPDRVVVTRMRFKRFRSGTINTRLLVAFPSGKVISTLGTF